MLLLALRPHTQFQIMAKHLTRLTCKVEINVALHHRTIRRKCINSSKQLSVSAPRQVRSGSGSHVGSWFGRSSGLLIRVRDITKSRCLELRSFDFVFHQKGSQQDIKLRITTQTCHSNAKPPTWQQMQQRSLKLMAP